MTDGSYNGFYTNCIDSISHIMENGVVVSKVYLLEGNVKTIPVEEISDVSFESALLDKGNPGDYKICELEGDNGFKKAYIDNRASLIASRTGNFYANDTILFASAYNNIKFLLFTGENGQVTRYFDGENYLIFDKDDAFQINTRASIKTIWSVLYKALQNKGIQALLKLNESSLSYLAQNMDIIANDPELQSERLLLCSLSMIASLTDPIAYLTSILAVTTDNDMIKLLDEFYGGVGSSFMDLLNALSPDYETRKKYKDYYANKYNIFLSTESASDITATSATFNGAIYTEDGLRGDLYFHIQKATDLSDEGKDIPCQTIEYVKVNQWQLNSSISSLEPDTMYMLYLKYVCAIDKLKLEYLSDAVFFMTHEPLPITGKANVTDNSAVIECEYKNAEGMWCGLQYSYSRADGAKGEGVITVDSDGKQSITISDLVPCATYTYRAVISYGEESYVGESKTFTANPPDISGVWSCTVTSYTATGQPKYKTYDITLNKDGSVLCDDVMQILGSSWRLKKTGEVRIDINIISRKDYDQGQVWQGKIDDFDNPKKITGSTYYWNATTVGYYEGDGRHIEMTR